MQRSVGEDSDSEDGSSSSALIGDLKELLQLKLKLDRVRAEANEPDLEPSSKLEKLTILQETLNELNALRQALLDKESGLAKQKSG